jgi:hypothetical protein
VTGIRWVDRLNWGSVKPAEANAAKGTKQIVYLAKKYEARNPSFLETLENSGESRDAVCHLSGAEGHVHWPFEAAAGYASFPIAGSAIKTIN